MKLKNPERDEGDIVPGLRMMRVRHLFSVIRDAELAASGGVEGLCQWRNSLIRRPFLCGDKAWTRRAKNEEDYRLSDLGDRVKRAKPGFVSVRRDEGNKVCATRMTMKFFY